MAPAASKTTALIVDGAYARIQGRILGGGVDFARLRTVLEREAGAVFEECWYFDNLGGNGQCHAAMTVEYNALKRARPHGPQFQVQLYPLKKYKCFCKRCDNRYVQMVQKGVDNGIATKMLRLTLKHGIERIILVSGDGDFYATLNSLRNEDRKEVWVAGFCSTVSSDLQQLASHIIWIDDLWDQVRGWDCGRESGGRGRGRESGATSYRFGANQQQLSSASPPRRHSSFSRGLRSAEYSGDRVRIAGGNATLERYGPAHRNMPTSEHSDLRTSCRPAPSCLSPRTDLDLFDFDDLNESGSDEDMTSCSSRPESRLGRDGADNRESKLFKLDDADAQFFLPMAVPVSQHIGVPNAATASNEVIDLTCDGTP